MEREGVKKKRFDKAFKIQAVKMVTEEGQKASEVARSLGIHPNQSSTAGKGSMLKTAIKRLEAKGI